ncbi:DUF805 domain-containing protein [Pseudovibrio ascidiaceicola]|uniref:Uncharacterized membrane protein YhaH, DUF805 family n=1 Tax=Pseudovibrio ascidiaceicola TaxID=285279 RepID=A0A1I3X6E2_9HYPH|nr:DUF805 domain-containing protein [Pseudovibrio ascidiaceicola]SFK15183.1 Uncharacterized membrane protein YhaH, DUF805 family [Pseudovibrio ascidiaceicola]
MTFNQAVRTCFKKYAHFYGRASRSEFWWWVLFSVIMSMLAAGVDGLILESLFQQIPESNQHTTQPIGLIVSAILLLPGLAVGVRRLHDVNYSGFWLFLWLLPIIGWVFLLYLHVLPSREVVIARYQ